LAAYVQETDAHPVAGLPGRHIAADGIHHADDLATWHNGVGRSGPHVLDRQDVPVAYSAGQPPQPDLARSAQ
jgi:hypothetical protein